MKFFEADFLYSHSWENVTTAIWKKYPNDKVNHVLKIDTLSHSVDPTTGVLTVERLLTCKQKIPYLIQQLLGGNDISYVHEVAVINPKDKTFSANSVNLTFSNLMTVEESVQYRPDPSRVNSTLFKQQAQITALGGLSKLAGYVEDFSLTRFQNNAALGREALTSVLEKLFENKDRQHL
ncbi:Phospholipid metabolism protein [Entomophthora muscae]|uniref:Phospholipid metabolism protein n=1 Tax=Entomophthora muscae TaxID=34485 RepID=A0ACC2TD81_9FUNG|nr:Phospholipid metabolism protein [Entomophthora muscae]